MDMANRKTLSDGLWMLTWKRLKADRVAMCSMGIVLLFLVMIVLSVSGLVASDWSKEVGVHYAPPDFIGVQTADGPERASEVPAADLPPENVVKFIADVTDSDWSEEVTFGSQFSSQWTVGDDTNIWLFNMTPNSNENYIFLIYIDANFDESQIGIYDTTGL